MKKRFRRQHLNPAGEPKTPFRTEATARHAAETFGMDVYRCKHCGCWHLATRKPSNKKRPATTDIARAA